MISAGWFESMAADWKSLPIAQPVHESGGTEDVPLAVEKRWFLLPVLHNLKLGSSQSPRIVTVHLLRQPVGAGRMDYAMRVAANEPIGSGVTEAACKVIVKQRLYGSGMKWTEGGAAVVLSLRTLSYTSGRWDEFWSKVDR